MLTSTGKASAGDSSAAASARRARAGAPAVPRAALELTGEAAPPLFPSLYRIQADKVLGSGASGSVKLAVHRQTGQKYALKTLHVDRFERDAMDDLRAEIGIMLEVDHPNIIRLQEVFHSDDHIYLVMELCSGGELLNRLNAQRGHHYSERKAARYLLQMCHAVRYLHEHKICHRDLKLENFILDSKDDDAQLVLIDFGLSKHLRKARQHMHRAVGTPFYVAPEVLEFNYTIACDMWSLGVITYMLLCGRPPFSGYTDEEILQHVLRGHYHYPSKLDRKISANAKDFIRRLLQPDPHDRMTAEEALDHPWIHEWDGPEEPLDPEVLQELSEFRELTEFQRIAKEVLAYTFHPADVKKLHHEFDKIDSEGHGVITVSEFRRALAAANIPEAAMRSIFESVDVRHDNELSWTEFLAATVKVSEADDAALRAAFDRIKIDPAADSITPRDLSALCGVEPQHAVEIFEEVGTKVPGRVDFEEFCEYLRRDAHDHNTRGQKRLLIEHGVDGVQSWSDLRK